MVPHNLPQVYVLLSNLTMRVSPQSPSGICTLIQSDYEGPPTISLRYMYSYPIWLWGSLPTISLRYMYSYLICLWGSPTISLGYIIYFYPIWLWGSLPTISLRYMYSYLICLWGSPHNLPQVYVLLSNLTMRVPPQSPSGICTLIQSDYEGPPTISLRYMYSYPIWLWGSLPTISLRYMYSYLICLWGSPTISLGYIIYFYPIWLWGSLPTISLRYMYSYLICLWGSPHNLPQVYVLLSNLSMRVPPQSPSGICTLIQSDYDGPPTISLRYMYSYLICLWGSPHNLPQVYVLLSNLSMRVPPQSPSGICTLI